MRRVSWREALADRDRPNEVATRLPLNQAHRGAGARGRWVAPPSELDGEKPRAGGLKATLCSRGAIRLTDGPTMVTADHHHIRCRLASPPKRMRRFRHGRQRLGVDVSRCMPATPIAAPTTAHPHNRRRMTCMVLRGGRSSTFAAVRAVPIAAGIFPAPATTSSSGLVSCSVSPLLVRSDLCRSALCELRDLIAPPRLEGAGVVARQRGFFRVTYCGPCRWRHRRAGGREGRARRFTWPMPPSRYVPWCFFDKR